MPEVAEPTIEELEAALKGLDGRSAEARALKARIRGLQAIEADRSPASAESEAVEVEMGPPPVAGDFAPAEPAEAHASPLTSADAFPEESPIPASADIRRELAIHLLGVHFAKHGENTKYLQSLISNFDTYLEAAVSMESGSLDVTTRQKLRECQADNAELLRARADLIQERNRLVETNSEYRQRLASANLPT